MVDNLSKSRRSWNMSRIKGTRTKPEIRVRKALYSKGLRYKIRSSIVGKPDIVFMKKRIALFVQGCFWHQHGCKNSTIPKTNSLFWESKLNSNRQRDCKVYSELLSKDWNVYICGSAKSNLS